MSFFTTQTKVVEIHGPGGVNRVTVRKLSYGDEQAVMSEAMTIDVSTNNASAGAANVRIDAAKMQELQMVKAVVSWEGPDFDRPFSHANLLALPPDIVEIISAAVEELNQPLSETEKN